MEGGLYRYSGKGGGGGCVSLILFWSSMRAIGLVEAELLRTCESSDLERGSLLQKKKWLSPLMPYIPRGMKRCTLSFRDCTVDY